MMMEIYASPLYVFTHKHSHNKVTKLEALGLGIYTTPTLAAHASHPHWITQFMQE